MVCKQISNTENLPPHVLRSVSKEVVSLSQEPPEGIKVHINHDDITDIQATVVGPGKESTQLNLSNYIICKD